MVCFGKNDVVSCIFHKKGKQNNVVIRRHCFSFFFPWTCNRGREVFVFSSLFLPLYPSPRALLKPKPDATRTSSWWENRKVVPCKRRPYWPPLSTVWQSRRTSHPTQNDGMGQGWSRSLYPYKYCPNRGKKQRRISGEKKRIGGAEWERHEDFFERERVEEKGTKTVETKGKKKEKQGRTEGRRGSKVKKKIIFFPGSQQLLLSLFLSPPWSLATTTRATTSCHHPSQSPPTTPSSLKNRRRNREVGGRKIQKS